MDLFNRAKNIHTFLKQFINCIPDYAIVLGSGLGAFADRITKIYEIDYNDIPDFLETTVQGHKGKLIFGKIHNKKIIILQGRFHIYEGYTAGEVTLPIMVLHLLGVKNIILTNAAGGINTDFSPRDLMVLTDHNSLFCPTPLIEWYNKDNGDRFLSTNDLYTENLINTLFNASELCDIPLRKGVYCYCKGPMYETPSEIKMLRTCGCDAVGMSTVPEAILAKYLGMNILGISCITNMAAGISVTAPSHQEVIENGKAIEDDFCRLLNKFLEIV